MTEFEKEIKKLKEKISELENKLNRVEASVETIEKDIYLDEIEEDTIDCPDCNS